MFLLIDLSFPSRPLRIGVLRLSIGLIARPGTINHRDSPAVTISQYKYSDGCHLTWEAFPECNNSVTRGVPATGKLMFGDWETYNSDIIMEVELHAHLHMNARFSTRDCTASKSTVLFRARYRARDPRKEKKRERSRVPVFLALFWGFPRRQALFMVACFS